MEKKTNFFFKNLSKQVQILNWKIWKSETFQKSHFDVFSVQIVCFLIPEKQKVKKWSVGTVAKSTGDSMQLETEKNVLREFFLVLIVAIALTISKKWTVPWPKILCHQSSRYQVNPVIRSFRVTTSSLAPSTSSSTGVKQRKPSDTLADLNKKLEEEAEDEENLDKEKVINFQMSQLLT